MSVLDRPATPEITPALRVAAQIKQTARNTFQQLFNTFESSIKTFWLNPQATPAEIAAAIGTDAGEVFKLHAKLGAFLNDVKPGCVTSAASLVGDVTYHDDGTVTVKPKTVVTPLPLPVPPISPTT